MLISCQENIHVQPQEYQFTINEIAPFPPAVHGMAINPNDSILYFSDTFKAFKDTPEVHYINYPYNGKIYNTGIKGNGVSGLIWKDNILYVAFLYENKVRSYDSDFHLSNSWDIETPWNFTSDGKHIFLVTFNGNLAQLYPSDFKIIHSGLEMPFDIEYSKNNSFYISEQVGVGIPGRIKEISIQGDILDTIPIEFSNPEGLTLDDQSNLYISDTEKGMIYQHTKEGQINLITAAYKLPICIEKGIGNTIMVNTNHEKGNLLQVEVLTKNK